ncbi:MAG: DUF6625 family protein [Ferruginibacter sp.]
MNLEKIAILTCWHGKYPWYFPYFIHACSYNPTIDFYIITDNEEAILNKPVNVLIVQKKLDELKAIANKKLGFSVSINNAYKLNDFKPAYGFIFSGIVKNYDFWGHSDLDIIYGDIRNFLNSEVLTQYDFISLRHDYTTGCFCLYRNKKKINTLFKNSKDYKLVLSNPQHYCFDECNFAWAELRTGKSILELNTPIESFTYVVKKAAINNEIKAHFDFILIEGRTGRVVFDKGKITYKKKFEAILYHLVELKKIYSPEKVPKKIPARYCISSTRIYH